MARCDALGGVQVDARSREGGGDDREMGRRVVNDENLNELRQIHSAFLKHM